MDLSASRCFVTRKLLVDLLIAIGSSVLFLILCYLRLWGDSTSAAFNLQTLDPQLLHVAGTALGRNLLQFAVAQLALHIALGLLCLGAAQLSQFAWPAARVTRTHWLCIWFVAASVWLLAANATLFPLSAMGEPYAESAHASWHGIRPLEVFTVGLVLGSLVTLARVLQRLGRKRAVTLAVLMTIPVLVAAASSLMTTRDVRTAARHDTQPNIVLLGLDSLRADAVGKGNTPAIDGFLKESVVFNDAVTPIARTFPAWVSIITGRHPHTTGATTNLIPRQLIRTGQTLPQMLAPLGYRSVYAIDESRFSNLDTSYGFDEAVTPPMGASDFVLGFLTDTPLSNMTINTFIGRWLFPHAYANRGSALTYDPDSFVKRLKGHLPTQTPVLIATHLTLAHLPFVWAHQQPALRLPDGSMNMPELYSRAVRRLDRQFSDVLALLQSKGILDNALVVVFSDHGESLGEPCVAPRSSAAAEAGADCSLLGHGTSVLAAHQYHIILGVRRFARRESARPYVPRTLTMPVSLEDITPTLAELLDRSTRRVFDGKSLAAVLQGDATAALSFQGRVRFIETEFNPSGFDGGDFASQSAMRRASTYYQVDPVTDRITLRENEIPGIVLDRQRGALKDGHLLVADPTGRGAFRLICATQGAADAHLVDYATMLADPTLAELWSALQRRFPEVSSAVKLAATVK